MSFIVTGIDPPKCCIDCPIHDYEFGNCRLIPNSRYYDDNGQLYDPFTEKHKDCPLRGVKDANNI